MSFRQGAGSACAQQIRIPTSLVLVFQSLDVAIARDLARQCWLFEFDHTAGCSPQSALSEMNRYGIPALWLVLALHFEDKRRRAAKGAFAFRKIFRLVLGRDGLQALEHQRAPKRVQAERKG